MDVSSFWHILAVSRAAAGADPATHIRVLREQLMALAPAEIVEFDRIFREHMARAYDWNLWGAAYVIGGGCSDDGFTDFRAWLVSKGQEVFESALRDPDSLADVLADKDGDAQFEEFAYAASQAWEQKLGKSAHDFPGDTPTASSELTGEPWNEDEHELAARYPRLWAFSGA
ncbi:DUF4240 domain-containing protein [Massilia sp. PAMC28688]|uniref:DUF4240 domain-containing protein n=1 Tax=Massilia sp. PAMC28688 TaxID=2861283 RepID=UPI001C634FC7|nr:DUF4240 domain-containing protein [Massilia sp. PAMC28688]QYF93554.1 DUF4240 domain-containing protein [Massilia sp. PAMC28688]